MTQATEIVVLKNLIMGCGKLLIFTLFTHFVTGKVTKFTGKVTKFTDKVTKFTDKVTKFTDKVTKLSFYHCKDTKMSFDYKKCSIPTTYCGKEKKIPKTGMKENMHYVRHGTGYECLQKGVGIATITAKNKNLPPTSLQRIMYVGETYEKRFAEKGITTIQKLLSYSTDVIVIEKMLKKVFTKTNGTLDQRAYNSTLFYMYSLGKKKLPGCVKIKLE